MLIFYATVLCLFAVLSIFIDNKTFGRKGFNILMIIIAFILS